MANEAEFREGPTPDELEQQRESDPEAEHQNEDSDPEHPSNDPVWPDPEQAERLGEVDPADLIEQAQPTHDWPQPEGHQDQAEQEDQPPAHPGQRRYYRLLSEARVQ